MQRRAFRRHQRLAPRDLVRTHYSYAKLLVWYLVRDESPTSYWRSGLATYDWQQKPAYGLYATLSAK